MGIVFFKVISQESRLSKLEKKLIQGSGGVSTLPTPDSTSTSGAPVLAVSTMNASYPAQVVNLTNWKVTLPIGESGRPLEIKQPSLSKYKIDPWFIVASTGNGIRFRAPVTGVTTKGSKYPRSELREMSNNGLSNAAWSSDSGTHTFFIDQAITSVPETKKHVVAGQIHDASRDIMVIRLEYPNLYVNVDGKNMYTLDSRYTFGKRFSIKLVVAGGKTDVYYNGGTKPVYTLNLSYSGAYFKTGVYTQSNCTKERASSCNENNFGEVILYKTTVTHQ